MTAVTSAVTTVSGDAVLGRSPMMDAEGPLKLLVDAFEMIALGIDLIGVTIVLFGFVVSFVALVRTLARGVGFQKCVRGLHGVRLQLGTYILVGVEFMIASDIINTVITRELESLAFVAALVAIRTAISFFLGRELADVSRDGEVPERS